MFAYVITNKINGKRYIGVTTCLSRRWKRHCASSLKGSKLILHCAMRKHGLDNFTCEHIASCLTWDDLLAVERILIEQFQTHANQHRGYNATLGGEGALGYKFSPEMIARIRLTNPMTESTKLKIGLANKGRRPTPETRAKLSAIRTGKPLSAVTIEKMKAKLTGQVRSDAVKRKMSLAKLGRPLSPAHIERIRAAHGTPEARAARSAMARGKPMSDNAKTALLKANLGRAQSEATRAKRIASLAVHFASALPRITTQETRSKISAGNKGKVRTIEQKQRYQQAFVARGGFTKEAMAKSVTARIGMVFTPAHKANLSAASRGKPKTEQHRAAMRASHAKRRNAIHSAEGLP